MTSEDWVVRVDPSNRTSIEIRELYAYAGMALAIAQELEHVLKNFVILARAIETRPKVAEKLERFKVEMEKFEGETFKKTLGPLVNSIKSRFHFSTKPSLASDLEQSLKDRNQLVHHFFWDSAVQLRRSSEERRKMGEELKRISKQLRTTVEDFSDATKGIHDAMGITKEAIMEVVEASMAGASEQEVKKLIREKRAKRASALGKEVEVVRSLRSRA
jgi:hypothetical protein